MANSPNFRFFGNVEVGKDVSLPTLRDNYDAVLFTYGASQDRRLQVPGEDLGGVYSARAFVGWYNGLPEYAGLSPDLEAGDTAVVIGQGNVALDVARILLSGVDRLKNTDITEEALAALARSRVKQVHVVGRRGPVQAAFTIKEVRELLQLPHVQFEAIPGELLPLNGDELPRAQKRISQLLTKHSTAPAKVDASSHFSLRFLLSPTAFHGSANCKLAIIDFARNTWIEGSHPFHTKAGTTATNDTCSIDAALAFRSIGYKSVPLPGMDQLGVDFDRKLGIIMNRDGRILSDGRPMPGLYCAGWVKSGPNGVIATTMEDAFATAEAIAADWNGKKSSKGGSHALNKFLGRSVDWTGWQRIDAAERARGALRGKQREKFRSIDEMLSAA